MTIKPIPQFIPQVIMAGHDLGLMTRDELRQLAIHSDDTPLGEATTRVAFLVDGAKR
jgi:hypothetical protein